MRGPNKHRVAAHAPDLSKSGRTMARPRASFSFRASRHEFIVGERAARLHAPWTTAMARRPRKCSRQSYYRLALDCPGQLVSMGSAGLAVILTWAQWW